MLPLKVAILDWAMDHKDQGFKVEDILEAMKPLYGSERQCNLKRIESYCQDYMMNGFFVAKEVSITEEGEADVTYKVTQYAIDRGNRFIPERKK